MFAVDLQSLKEDRNKNNSLIYLCVTSTSGMYDTSRVVCHYLILAFATGRLPARLSEERTRAV